MPWGTHFCCFHETQQDLIDTLVLFFRAGLENNEFCLWVVFDPLTEEDARGALLQAAPELDRYLAEGCIEIRLHDERFFQGGAFGPDGIVHSLHETLQQALTRGHAGMRVAGSPAELHNKDSSYFREFERELDRSVTDQPMIALCQFPLAENGAAEILDAGRIHQFAAAMRQGDWQILEIPELKRAKAEIAKLNELEQRVEERTWALVSANEQLRQEIAQRKQVEGELRKQKEILQSIVDHVPAMLKFTNQEGETELVNREWERVLGWSLSEMVSQGVDIYEEVYPDPKYRQSVLDFVAHSDGEWADFKTTIRGGLVIDTTWAVVRLSDGARICIGQDITQRKRAEEALRESEERFRQLAENIREMFWITTPDLKEMLYLSPAYESVTGRSREGLNGFQQSQSLLELIHPEDRASLAELAERRVVEEFDVEFRIIRPGGAVRWIRDRGFPIRDPSGKVYRVGGVAEDITERKLAQEKLKATTEQLRALSANLQSIRESEGTRVARRIHDELGGSITSLRWELEALGKMLHESRVEMQCPALEERLETMFRLADATINAVRQIASELRPSILDDIGLVEAIEWQAQRFQASTGITCQCNCSAENMPLGAEQSTAVFRIFQEALTNILRHARATRVQIATEEMGGAVVLTVRDNGKGITEAEKSGRPSLGILEMQERAHLVGGTINIAGMEGKGTTVILRVPVSGESEKIDL
jgi:PAS domain S-box-containing protein